jgi:hypothetical protein
VGARGGTQESAGSVMYGRASQCVMGCAGGERGGRVAWSPAPMLRTAGGGGRGKMVVGRRCGNGSGRGFVGSCWAE